MAFLFAGAAVGVFLIMLLDKAFIGSYTAFFLSNDTYSSTNFFIQPTSPVVYYLQSLFPTNIAYSYAQWWVWPYAMQLGLVPELPYWPSNIFFSTNHFGFFGYAMLLCALYLAFKRDKRLLFPSAWFLVAFGYLSFGIAAGQQTIGFIRFDPRYLIVIVAPLALIIGIGFDRVLSDIANIGKKLSRNGRTQCSADLKRYALYIILLLGVAVLFATSLYLVQFDNQAYKIYLHNFVEAGSFINTLPESSEIYLVSEVANVTNERNVSAAFLNSFHYMLGVINWFNFRTVGYFGGYAHNYNYNYTEQNCSAIPAGAYIVVLDSSSWFFGPSPFWNMSHVRSKFSCPNLEQIPVQESINDTLSRYGIPIANTSLAIYKKMG